MLKYLKIKDKNLNNVKDANIKDLEISVSNKIGLNVLIKNKKNNKGKITFEYKGLRSIK